MNLDELIVELQTIREKIDISLPVKVFMSNGSCGNIVCLGLTEDIRDPDACIEIVAQLEY